MTTVCRVIALVVAVVVVAPRAGMALDAACGLTVPPGETAVLQGDLTCPSDPVAITLDKASALDLHGFTLRVSAPDSTGVVCADRACSIVSSVVTPGVISGEATGGYGISIAPGPTYVTNMLVQNVIVQDFADIGVYGTGLHGKTTLKNVTVSGCSHEGINVSRKLVVNNVASNNNADGIVGPLILKGVGLTVNGNTDKGMWHIERATLTDLMASGNGVAGMEVSERTVLRDSALSGNGKADIVSGQLPHLINTTCERSLHTLETPGPTWGVCALD